MLARLWLNRAHGALKDAVSSWPLANNQARPGDPYGATRPRFFTGAAEKLTDALTDFLFCFVFLYNQIGRFIWLNPDVDFFGWVIQVSARSTSTA